jgi:Ca2+-binding EF-hand superfamily protein
LAELYNFEPRTAFKRLDRSRNYRINHLEIQDFLRDNYINVLSSEAKLLIAAYDDDKDGDLDFKEFEKLILPATNNALKLRTYDRQETFVGYREKLHYRIEDSLARLFKSEIDKLKELDLDKEIVLRRYDFSRYDAFKVIDKYRINSLLREDLRSFLNINGVYATALDADNLMRRMDLDNDGRITYSEFCDFLE